MEPEPEPMECFGDADGPTGGLKEDSSIQAPEPLDVGPSPTSLLEPIQEPILDGEAGTL